MSDTTMRARAERACRRICADLGDPDAFELIRYDRGWVGDERATVLRRPRLASEGTGDISATGGDTCDPGEHPTLVGMMVTLIRARAREHAIAATGSDDPNPPWACHVNAHLLAAMRANALNGGQDVLLACERNPGQESYDGPGILETPGLPVPPTPGSKNLSLSIPTRYEHGAEKGSGPHLTSVPHPKVSAGSVRMLMEVQDHAGGRLFGMVSDFGANCPNHWLSFPERILPDTIVSGLAGLRLSQVVEHPLLQAGDDPVIEYARIARIPKPKEGQALIIGLPTRHAMMAPAPDSADLSWLDIGHDLLVRLEAPDWEIGPYQAI